METSRVDDSIVSSAVQSDKSLTAASKASSDKGNNELFQLNQVWYRMPPSLSLVSKRTLTKGFFQQTQYPKASGQTVVLTVNSGEFYVATKTSYLVISCGVDLAQASSISSGLSANNTRLILAQGDILNLIDEVFFTSASGTEIAREQQKCLQSAVIQRAQFSPEYVDGGPGALSGFTKGSLARNYGYSGFPGDSTHDPVGIILRDQYYRDTTSSTTKFSFGNEDWGSVDLCYNSSSTAFPNPTSAKTFIIPMSRILGCFAPYMNVLFPAAALAGGQLTIRFKDFVESLTPTGSGVSTTGAATALCRAVDIKNIYVLWDSFQLNDSVLKRLNEVAAGSEGLSVMFDCWDWSRTQTSALSIEAQISQARSRITRGICIVRDSGQVTNPWANSLASEAAVNRTSVYKNPYLLNGSVTDVIPLVRDYQAQLGSLYFPQQPLSLPEEYMMNALYVLGKSFLDPLDTSAMSLDDFYGANGAGHFDSTGAINAPNYDTAYPFSGTIEPPWTMNYGMAMYGFLAERGQLLQLTGLPISNARLLRHKFTFNYDTASKSDRMIDTFTQYTRCMKVFLGGRVVMRE